MVRINPGSNRSGDNDTRTATPGLRNVNIPEAKDLGNEKFQCTVCNTVFNSREAYISHAMTRHQENPEEISEKPIT